MVGADTRIRSIVVRSDAWCRDARASNTGLQTLKRAVGSGQMTRWRDLKIELDVLPASQPISMFEAQDHDGN